MNLNTEIKCFDSIDAAEIENLNQRINRAIAELRHQQTAAIIAAVDVRLVRLCRALFI